MPFPRNLPNSSNPSSKQKDKKILIGRKNSDSIKAITRPNQRKKALFISRLPNNVTNDELKNYIQTDTELTTVTCIRMKTKRPTYSSFYVTCAEDEFTKLSDPNNFPKDCLVTEFYGWLKDDQKFIFNNETDIKSPERTQKPQE